MSLTDKQLVWIFQNRLSHNGFRCCTVLHPDYDWSKPKSCDGKANIEGGKLKLQSTCGEPCTWVCKDTQKLAESLESIQFYNSIIEEAKNVK